MADSTVSIAIKAKNEASGAIKQVKSDLSGLDSAAQTLSGGLGGLAAGLGVGAVVAGFGQVVQAIDGAVASADRFGKVNASFQQLAASAGQSGNAILKALQSASAGMINDTDLMLAANKAMMLGVADNAEEMTALLNVARSRGQAMGIDVGQAFDNIVTGLGRESALILDNLGITIDTTAAMKAYADSLGIAVTAMDGAQRKQALLNEVMRQSQNIDASVPTGPGAAAAQAKVAQENAQVAVGQMWASTWREWADAQTDAINQMLGNFDAYAAKVRDVTQIAADFANDDRNSVVQKERWKGLAEAMQQVLQAQQRGIPNANAYADALTRIANEAELSRNISQQQANMIRLASDGIKEETAATNALAASMMALDPKLDQIRIKEQMLAGAANMAAAALRAQSAAFAMGVPSASAIPGGRGADYFGSRNAIIDPMQGQIDSMAARLVPSQGQQAALDWAHQQKLELRSQADALYEQGYSWTQIGNILLPSIVDQTGQWVSDTTKAASGVAKTNEEYSSLLSTVKSIISSAQSDIGGVDLNKMLPRQDAVNENARRLGAIANEGLINQPWLEEFKQEAPGAWADLMLKVAEGTDVKTAAAQILRDFQDGLRPDLIDKGLVKDRVKALILGDQNAAALAEEIAGELAQEMGIPIQQALAAAGQVMGVSTGAAGEAAAGAGAAQTTDMSTQGSAAGTSFAAGFAMSITGTSLVGRMVAEMDTAVLSWQVPGQNAGAMWGGGFMSTVESGMAPALISLLATLVTPGVLAIIQAGTSQTTPPDGGTP